MDFKLSGDMSFTLLVNRKPILFLRCPGTQHEDWHTVGA